MPGLRKGHLNVYFRDMEIRTMFIWIAVIAALLAVAAIAFGLWRDAREKQAENEYIELPQAAELPSAASQPEQLE
mgnify:FL=1